MADVVAGDDLAAGEVVVFVASRSLVTQSPTSRRCLGKGCYCGVEPPGVAIPPDIALEVACPAVEDDTLAFRVEAGAEVHTLQKAVGILRSNGVSKEPRVALERELLLGTDSGAIAFGARVTHGW